MATASLLVGSYTSGRTAEGLYACDVGDDLGDDPRDESIANDVVRVRGCRRLDDPSFVARHPGLPLGYVTCERPDSPGTIARIALDATTAPPVLETVSAQGRLPCHAAVTVDGEALWVACYGSGTVSVWRLAPDGAFTGPARLLRHDGRSVRPGRQDAPHPHAVVMHPNGRDVYVTDLGTDRIEHYRRGRGEEIERLDGHNVTPGAGPRHLALDAGGRRAVLANELDNTVDVFDVDGAGRLVLARRLSTLPPDFTGRSWASEVALSRDESAVFVGNRGHDSIARLAIDGTAHDRHWLPSGGRHPRHFALSPDGRRLAIANRDSDTVAVYRLDPPGGAPLAEAVVSAVPAPAFVMWR